jgi:Protein of unknown function (DUF2865)
MRQGVWRAVALVVLVVVQVTPAAAQGFLQQLFGLGNSAPAPQAAAPALMTPGGRPYTAPSVSNYGAYMSRRAHGDDDDHEQRSSGSYRTICVRTCDGYYFPISNSTTKRGFYRDNMKCRSQCGDDARIFFLPTKTTEVDGAVDLQGRQYGRMNTAYMYRKTLVAGCQCKPDPWADSELARHQHYADAELDKKLASLPKTDTATDTTGVATETTEVEKASDGQKVAEVPQPSSAKPTVWKTTTGPARQHAERCGAGQCQCGPRWRHGAWRGAADLARRSAAPPVMQRRGGRV